MDTMVPGIRNFCRLAARPRIGREFPVRGTWGYSLSAIADQALGMIGLTARSSERSCGSHRAGRTVGKETLAEVVGRYCPK